MAGQGSYSGAHYSTTPTNRDAEKALESNAVEVATEADKEIEVAKYYATLISEGKCHTWYIASCENRNGNGTFQMDHLIRVQKGNDLTWKLGASNKPETLRFTPNFYTVL